jgi:hypothetical protein
MRVAIMLGDAAHWTDMKIWKVLWHCRGG